MRRIWRVNLVSEALAQMCDKSALSMKILQSNLHLCELIVVINFDGLWQI